MSEPLRCSHCGDVIGVYEPLITVVEGQPHRTSRLADPLLTAREAGCFHPRCFEESCQGADSAA